MPETPIVSQPPHPIARRVMRGIAAAAFITAGVTHFTRPEPFRKIVPPGFGDPATLVALSGVFEILGGTGLLVPRLRKIAGWGLIALLIAVFPANVYMAVAPQRVGTHLPRWLLWLRLPFQPALIAWIWFAALRRPSAAATRSPLL